MQINVAQWRQIEHPFRNDASVSNHDDGARLQRSHLGAEFRVVFDGGGLRQWQAKFKRAFFYRGNSKLSAASAGPVRLAYYQLNLMAGGDERVQGRNRELRGAAEDEIHA